jgi:hypothetical protein
MIGTSRRYGVAQGLECAESRSPLQDTSLAGWPLSIVRLACDNRDRRGQRPRAAPLLILFTDSLGVGFAVRIEQVLAALLPRRLEFRRCDVPVWPTFLGNGT